MYQGAVYLHLRRVHPNRSRFRNQWRALTEGRTVMYFDEGRQLNYPRGSKLETSSRTGSARQQPDNTTYDDTKKRRPFLAKVPPQLPADWKTGGALDAANNRLQELMQLFYLLSRDPAIPQDARYHVTVAQSEIALLTRLMQNAENNGSQPCAPRDVSSAGNL
jgi:hypothetical protein